MIGDSDIITAARGDCLVRSVELLTLFRILRCFGDETIPDEVFGAAYAWGWKCKRWFVVAWIHACTCMLRLTCFISPKALPTKTFQC
jgi:hypothetical protein